jgi:hypothetical protein
MLSSLVVDFFSFLLFSVLTLALRFEKQERMSRMRSGKYKTLLYFLLFTEKYLKYQR